ncbi:hypothetical protein JOD02_001825 [Caldicoprobacter guelmensis]|uniref:acyclic terpene utilization AtuA family protein n=1 Tax=Caldicoprobacter guelmensis TaxID=1170224 RepID=UPI00195E05A5|nr:acyclic terpene utilization AtuA family protein [Caldicoprobacter guelmensis]MBM7582956.1 hypothetical protein [Caldicoprobacter guelmensis]
MKETVKILAPCGMLGYGYPMESFLNGIAEGPDAIVVDAGSTDAGPHKLGAGVSIVSRRATKKDLIPIITYGLKLKIPVIIGSAGGAGASVHVKWTKEIIEEILEEQNLKAKIAIIWADIPKDLVIKALSENKIIPVSKSVKPLKEDIVKDTNNIVAQMGHEPILKALEEKADIIICGRAYDPSPFAAVGLFYGFEPGLCYHLGKILECGALCAEPGTTKDCILGILKKDSFIVKPLNNVRKCYPTSVAAHTFYEKEHPFILKGPGFILDLEKCEFTQIEEGVVEVRNSRFIKTEPYYIKLEGARKIAYRTFVIAGVRDPLLVEKIEEVESAVEKQVREYYAEIPSDDYKINFYNYGKNGVMGSREIENFNGYEIGVLFEVIANTQELANAICASLRSTFLHYGYEGRKSTAGNLAFPFAPSDIEYGPVYEFSIYHLMEVEDWSKLFKIEYLWR